MRIKKTVRKCSTLILVLCIAFMLLASCSQEGDDTHPLPIVVASPSPGTDTADSSNATATDHLSPKHTEPFPGKIAIITHTADYAEEEYRSADALVAKYGVDKVKHRTWPVDFADGAEQMIATLLEIASDPDVGAIIINRAERNTNAAIDAVRALRGNEVFIVAASPAELPFEVAQRVDLAFDINTQLLGEHFAEQAIAMGAETIVHYSFSRHMDNTQLAMRRDAIRETAERFAVSFVDRDTPDPAGDGGIQATARHVARDLQKMVDEFGTNTAFFGTNCAMQIPLITQVIETGAIFPQPCCPSPYHGFPAALGIDDRAPTGERNEAGEEITALRDIREVIDETRNVIHAKGMSGRLSTWAVPVGMMWTSVGAEYAIAWLNSEAPQEYGIIDLELLNKLAEDYAESQFGERIGVSLNALTQDGRTYSNYILGLVSFLTY